MLSLSSMLFSGLAIVFLKKGVDTLPLEYGKHPLKVPFFLLRNKVYFIGGSMLLFGWLLRFLAINLSDFSYVRMIYVSHLIVVVVGSKLLVKEKLDLSLILSISKK